MTTSDCVDIRAESAVLDVPSIALVRLTPPRLRAESINRGHLVDRRLTSSARLGVISGPAGSGKSTLLAQCHAVEPLSVWLTLTEAENDPVLLWCSIIACIQNEIDGFGRAYAPRLGIAGETVVDEIVTLVTNELAERRSPVHLFLDDLHLVDDTDCLRSIHRFISRLPDDVRVTVASRTTSPIPVGKLRAEGQLIEFTHSELTLSDDEAGHVVRQFGIELDPELVTALNERAEGWPAGIALACMGIRGTEDAGAFIRAFAGTDRVVADYLMAEVLEQLAPVERQFLHETSVLRQMSGSLCDAMTGRSDGAQMLATLEGSNSFLFALDRAGEWYRYHHLFADLLVAEMHKDPTEERKLHDRAFEWFRDREVIGEAIHHGLLADRRDEAADLLCASWFQMMSHGQLATVRSLIEQLDPAEITGHQPLALAAAFAFGMSGRRAESRRYIEIAEHTAYDGSPQDGTASMQSCLALTRGCLALDGLGPALVDAQQAYDLEPPESPWRPLAALVVGLARIMNGDAEESVVFFDEACLSTDDATRTYALAGLALVALMHDEPARAAMLADEACAIIHEAGMDDLVQAAIACAAMALSSLALGDEKRARESLRKARRTMDAIGQSMPLDTMYGALLLAEASLELGNTKDAARYVGQAERIAATVADTGTMSERLEALAARLPSVPSNGTDSDAVPEFTVREVEVLALLPAQLTTREIGEKLFLSRNTIKTYLRRIYRKLDAASRDEAIVRAHELGVIGQVCS